MVLGIALLLSLTTAQDLRAWQDLNFGDSPEVVQTKLEQMSAEGRFDLTDSWLGDWYSKDPTLRTYDVNLAGVKTGLQFEFYDNKLFRLTFDTDGQSASYWDSSIKPDYAILRQVLVTALGKPGTSRTLEFFDTEAGYIVWGDIWKAEGVSRKLGIYETTSYEYGVELWIEWDWMVNFIAANSLEDQENAVQDAAGGF